MKKIWKKRKNSEAVSPVIATILMVAITVVLAAVLYVMVMGFGTTGTQTPTGAFTGTPATVTNGYKLQFGVITPSTKFTDCKVVVTINNVASAATVITMGGTVVGVNNLIWTDLAADGAISQGDYLTITGGTTGSPTALVSGSYIVTLLFTSTGGSICSQSWSF